MHWVEFAAIAVAVYVTGLAAVLVFWRAVAGRAERREQEEGRRW